METPLKEISVTECSEIYLNKHKNLTTKLGIKIHKYIEEYLTKNKIPIFKTENSPEEIIFKQFLNFLKAIPHLSFYKAEKKISYIYKEYLMKGRIDAIFKDPEHEIYHLFDWKISHDMNSEQYHKNVLIQNMYKKIFPMSFEQPIQIHAYLIIFHHEHMNYIIYKIPNNNISLEQILDRLLIP